MMAMEDGSSIHYHYNALFLRKIERCSKEGESLYTHYFDTYDLSGNLLKSRMIGAGGEVFFEYDALHRPKAIRSTQWSQTVSGYDCQGNLSGLTATLNLYISPHDRGERIAR
jgi:YD repeat-containing protein